MANTLEETLAQTQEHEGWMRLSQGELLSTYAPNVESLRQIVEIDSCQGNSTIVLSQAAASVTKVVAIDLHAGNNRGSGGMAGGKQDGQSDNRGCWLNLNLALRGLRSAGLERVSVVFEHNPSDGA